MRARRGRPPRSPEYIAALSGLWMQPKLTIRQIQYQMEALGWPRSQPAISVAAKELGLPNRFELRARDEQR